MPPTYERTPYLAKRADGPWHVVVWAVRNEDLVPGGELSQPIRAASVASFNDLMRASDPFRLLCAISALGPLQRGGSDVLQDVPGTEFARMVDDGELTFPDEAELKKEAVLPPVASKLAIGHDGELRTVGMPYSKAARRAIERFAVDGALLDLFRSEEGAEWSVRIEPLQDWLFVRSLLQVAAAAFCLRSDVLGKGCEESLREVESRSGFRRVAAGGLLEDDCLALPFSRNPYRWAPILSYGGMWEPLGDLRRRALRPPIAGRAQGDALVSEAEGFDGLALVASAERTTSGRELLNDGLEVAAIPLKQGSTVADALDRALDSAMAALDAMCAGSRTCCEAGSTGVGGKDDDELAFGHRTVPAVLWETFRRHHGHKLILCEKCGCAVLASTRGVSPRFCSTSCRTGRFKNRRKTEGGTGGGQQ